MSTQTINYGFTKDDINEPYDVLKVNSNLDAIDAEIKEKETQIGDKANLVTVTKTNLVAAINEVKEQTNSLVADYIRSPGYGVTTGSANIYALTLNPALAAYTSGVCVAVKINIANTGASTININNLGPKAIKDSKGNALVAGKLVLNGVYTLRYDGANFILQGEGGEYGTATASDVLSGKTIGTDNGLVEGTIPSKAAATITPSTIAQTIAAGQYLSGIQTILGDADLISANIKAGANIFNVAGNSNVVDTSAGDAIATQILSGKKAYVDGALITGTMPSNGSQTVTLTTQGATKVVPAGYTTGGTVTASFANLVAGNVKNQVNIGGVIGTLAQGTIFTLANFNQLYDAKGLTSSATYRTYSGTNGTLTSNAFLIRLYASGTSTTGGASCGSPIFVIGPSALGTVEGNVSGVGIPMDYSLWIINPTRSTVSITSSTVNGYIRLQEFIL